MSKSKLCLLVVMIMVIAIGVTTAFSVASAVEDDRYIEADISLSADSVLGNSIVANVDYWTSVDKTVWDKATDFDPSWCDVIYYNAEDNSSIGKTAPQTVGKYLVRVIVNDSYDRNNYFFGKNKLAKDMVLASFSYQIAYENIAVVFAPNKQVDYFADKDYSIDAINDTKVYYKGVALQNGVDYTISVQQNQGDVFVDVTEAINPGEYKVCVTLTNTYANANIQTAEDKVFTSIFNIVNSVANIVRLNETKIYEGMYLTDSATRDDYYNIKYQGLLTTESVFEGKYQVSFISDRQTLATAPTEAGKYSVRFTFNQDIDEYGIKVGDFIDLDYEIFAKPYSVTYDNTAVSSDGYSLIYQGRPVLITPSFDRDLTIDSSKTKYYRYTSSDTISELTYGEYPTEVGRYRVVFVIDVSSGLITGSSMFGVADKDYFIDATNNVLTYEFQIIPRMTVNFSTDYPTVDTGFSSIVDYTGKKAVIISALKDSTLADIPTEIYTVKYYDESGNETSAVNPGEYRAVIEFNSDSISGVWKNGETEIADGTKLYYNFKVSALKPSVSALKINNGIILNFGSREVNASNYSVRYFKYDSILNYKTTQSELVNQVGKYHIVVSFTADNFDLGIASGDVFVIEYENRSEGSLENVKLMLDNAIDSGNGMTIDYDGNIKVVDVKFDGVSDLASTLNYTLYYQKLSRNGAKENEVDWNVCDYPKMPGTYRAIFVVNEDNVSFNAKSGDSLVYEFSIKSLRLSASFSVKVDEHTKDLVYDNNPNGKDFNVEFTVNGRKTVIDSNAYTLRFATVSNGNISSFVSDKPVNAGDYVIAVYFKYSTSGEFDKYGIYTDEPTLTNPDDFTRENMAVRSVFSGVITVQKLALTIVAKIPVEEKGMYKLSGGEVKPIYTFYKTNGFAGDISTLTDEQKLSYVTIDDFDSELFTGNLNSISCDTKVDKAVATGRYVNNLSLKESSRNNIVIDKIAYTIDGAKQGVQYSSDIYCASKKDDYSFTVEYRISPLPLIINSTALESIAENLFEEHYFGNTYPVSIDGLIFSTVDKNGVKYDIGSVYPEIKNNLASYVSLRYYKRLTGETTTEANAIEIVGQDGKPTYDLASVSDYMFAVGDYSLRLTFDVDSAREYDFFTLVNGKDENGSDASGSEIEKGSYADIRFTVKSANALRVVFVRDFNTFVYDNTSKDFDIKFMSGNTEVSLSYTLTKIRVVNGVEEIITDASFPKAVGKYALQVRFESDFYKYKIQQGQNSGVYNGLDEYVNNQSTVKFYYEITNPQYLSWEFIRLGEVTTPSFDKYAYEFDGESESFTIRFFDANNPDLTVNLISNVDYVIWYYAENELTSNYTKLLSAPSKTGGYVAELVFLRTLYDYRISDEIGYPYGYDQAKSVDGRFGKSLSDSSNNELSLNMINEKRYIKFDIVPSKVVLNGVSASDKQFDNTDQAIISGKWVANVTDSGKLVDGAVDSIMSLLSNKVIARFENIAVGTQSIDLYLKLSENVYIKLPTRRELNSSTALAFVKEQIETIKASASSSDSRILDEFEQKLNEIYDSYDVSFEDVTANITQKVVTIKPVAFAREFDPFYRDTDNLTFTYSDELLSALVQDSYPFVGSLKRDGDGTENAVGQYKINLGTLAIGDIEITLASGETKTASECFKVKLDDRNVYYNITKRAITVNITDGLTKYYDEDDPDFVCKVISGNLINGDKLLFDGEHKPIRQSKQDRDDVGAYSIDMSPVIVVDSSGTDISENYKISFVKQNFTILPREIEIIPTDYKNAKYNDNFYEIYSLNANELERKYSIKCDKNGIPADYIFNDGYKLVGNFGLEQVVSTESTVSAKFKITLGNIGVQDPNGKNVTKNYIITSTKTAYYTVVKYNVVLVIAEKEVSKTFGEDDPVIKLKQDANIPLPKGYSLREDSSASREEGESVGSYQIKTRDASKIYIVEDATGEVVTKYFNVTIRNQTSEQYPNGTVFVIEKYVIHVSVKDATFVKGDSTIIGELVFKNSDGKNVPQRILDKLTVTFEPVILNNPVEGTNAVEPIMTAGSDADSNFEIVTERGVITVIFPENNVTYKSIDKNEKVMQANSFILVKGMLLETKQMYLASTDNGKDPTKMVTITLPVDEELLNKEIYVVAVRKDGKYEILKVDVIDGSVVITDNQFNYILLCQSKSWPIVVIIIVVVIMVLGIIGFVFVRLRRRKRRNGEKPINFRKKAKKIENESEEKVSGYKPGKNATSVDEFGELGLDETESVETAPTTTEFTETPVVEDKKDKKKKNGKKAKTDDKPTLSGVVPSSVEPKPTETETSKTDVESVSTESTAITPSIIDSDEIVITPDKKKGETVSAEDIKPSTTSDYVASSDSIAPSVSSDDEIIISTSRRLGEDDN